MTATLPTSITNRTLAEKRYILKIKTQTENVKSIFSGKGYRAFLTFVYPEHAPLQQIKYNR